jgi:hydroxyethylthiazole kinase-like sugar kinase family protein
MATLAKVITAKMVVWVRNGKAMLAKCVKSGRFVRLADAQFLLDNIAACAAKAVHSAKLADRIIGQKLYEQLKATVGKISFEHEFQQQFRDGSELLACRLLCSNR